MNHTKLEQLFKKYTVPAEEVFADFTPEEKREVEALVRRYDMLVKLRKLRKKANLTQAQLAAKAKLPRTTISKIESGEYNPTVRTLIAIAAAMNKVLLIDFV